MSYTNLVYHIVFRTYRSVPAIDEEHERELYAYAHGYITRPLPMLYEKENNQYNEYNRHPPLCKQNNLNNSNN